MKYIPLLLLLLCSVHYKLDYVNLQWLIGSIILVVLLKVPSHAFGIFVGYVLSSVCVTLFNLYGSLPEMTVADQTNYQLAAAKTGFLIVLFLMAARSFKKEHISKVLDALPLYGIINSIYVIVTWLLGLRLTNSMGPQGFIDYSGLNSILICYSMVCIISKKDQNKLQLIPCAIAVMLSRSSVGFGVVASGVAAYLLCSGFFKKEIFLKLLLVFIGVISVGFLSEGLELFDSGNRFQAYSVFMSHWTAFYNNWLGAGPGSFEILSYNISKTYNFMPMADGKDVWYWRWMHSDWLTVLFEYGWVGFVLLLATFVELAYELFKAKESTLFALLISVAASAIFAYPARYFPTAIVCAVIILGSYLHVNSISDSPRLD